MRSLSPPTEQRQRFLWCLGFICLALAVAILGLFVGPTPIGIQDAIESVFEYDYNNNSHFVICQLRLPRVVLTAMIGACLASSGAMMQGVTRNPLAGPSIMGLSSGGTLCLLVGILVNPQLRYTDSIGLSLAGSMFGYLAVCATLMVASKPSNGATMALAGVIVSSLFGAITHGLTIVYSLHDEMLFWTVGGVSHVTWTQVLLLTPLFGIGLCLAIVISPSVTLLSLGEEIAAGLGQTVRRTRLISTIAVLILTGGAIAVAGPVSFVGLMVPHLSRSLIGADYRRIIPLSIPLGACLTMLADTLARFVGGNQELPLGLMTTLIGAPFFVYLASRRASASRPRC